MAEHVHAAVKELIDVGLELATHLRGERVWLGWLKKFNLYLAKLEPTEYGKLIPIFQAFRQQYRKALVEPIFIEDAEGELDVNDGFLRCPKESARGASSKSWLKQQQSCRGLVIYAHPGVDALKAVSIPISEMYEEAIKLRLDEEFLTYPVRVLEKLYNVLIVTSAAPESDPTVALLMANLEMVKSVSAAGPEQTPAAESEGALSGLSGVMSALFKKGDGILGGGEGGIGSVVEKIAKEIDTGTADPANPEDLKSVIKKIGKALGNDDIVGSLATNLEQLETTANTLVSSIPTEGMNLNDEKSNDSAVPTVIPTDSKLMEACD